ncbi:MAG: CHAT domain-containing protein, partial [Deltaproteobacteria bacterium]|nr:CHAT domain-containing protein [Deltaproteobacteria bacterium]
DLTTFGDNPSGAVFFLTGSETLNITDGEASVAALGSGNGGTVVFTTANLISNGEPDPDISATSGIRGTFTLVRLDAPPPPDDPIPPEFEGSIPVVDSIEQLISVTIATDPGFEVLDDPVGFGDLQPVEVAAATVGEGSADGSSEEDSEEELPAGSDPMSVFADEQVAEAMGEPEAEEKNAQIPGVALFSNSSQRAPLVPRTCDSLAGGETKSKLLARSSKRIPTSPEDWLIAFDATGEQLLAAVENPDLPPVAALEPDGANLEEVQRNARIQRALISAASAVRGGRYEDAATGFEQAVSELEEAGDLRSASEALLAYAQVQQSDGRFAGARYSLERALALAEPLGDEEHTAAVRTSLGNALIGTGELVRAEEELTRGLKVVIKSKNNAPAPSVLNNLGNRHAATRDFKSALWAYERSAKLARDLGRKGDEARALSGAARVAAESGQLTEASKLLERARPLVDALGETRERVPLYIHMGRTFAQFAASSPQARKKSLMNAYEAFDAALEGAEEIGDLHAVALANLNLGALYRSEQHRSEALYLTRLARQVNAALASHRRAIAILEETKPVASDGYGSSAASFRMAVGAVYQDTVDLMLRAASLASNDRTSERLIVEARNTLEKLKAAELRDYFEDECIANVSGGGRGIDNLGGAAAVVYTVTLPDRIELLVGLPSGVERFTTKVSAVRLNKTVDRFRRAVQNPLTNEHQALGQKLYEWTVAPYAERVAEAGIKTLVFIPDGRLRTLPFAALNDDGEYLSERYATATALSLRLLASPELASEAGRPV